MAALAVSAQLHRESVSCDHARGAQRARAGTWAGGVHRDHVDTLPSQSARGVYMYIYIHIRKMCTCGCAVLLCLVCLFDLACFFLSSFSSLINNMYILGLVFGVFGGFITPAFSFILS